MKEELNQADLKQFVEDSQLKKLIYREQKRINTSISAMSNFPPSSCPKDLIRNLRMMSKQRNIDFIERKRLSESIVRIFNNISTVYKLIIYYMHQPVTDPLITFELVFR